MDRQIIYNEKNERMFDVVKEGEATLVEVKTGKGGYAYKYMDAIEAIEKIKIAAGMTTEL